MEKLVGWSFAAKEKPTCDKCGMEKKEHKGCCHDENKIVKVDKDHKAPVNSYDFSKLQPSVLKANSESIFSAHVFDPVTSYPVNNAPPIIQGVPIYLSNSFFRI